jgi:hypothetical protein
MYLFSWLEYEMFPKGSRVEHLVPSSVALFEEVLETLGSGA